jgi:hypothetical protein
MISDSCEDEMELALCSVADRSQGIRVLSPQNSHYASASSFVLLFHCSIDHPYPAVVPGFSILCFLLCVLLMAPCMEPSAGGQKCYQDYNDGTVTAIIHARMW